MPETENHAPSAAARARQLRAGGVAVHQHLERPLAYSSSEDLAHHLVGLAGVDHQRQAGLARRAPTWARNTSAWMSRGLRS